MRLALSATSYENFVEELLSMYWARLDTCLTFAREHISTTVRIQLNAALARLQTGLENEFARERIRELSRAVALAGTDLQAAIDRVCGWFRRRRAAERRPFNIEVAIDVATKEAKHCFSLVE